MIFGSVCSGIEAASVAWHPLGWRASFLSEIEAFPRAVLAHHYPETPLHGDFTTIEAGQYEPIDLLVGGTPCQSFSIAGLRGGLDDDRGNLALEYLRLADRLRPRWLVWENVPGVLSSNGGRDFGAILGGMVELGYGFAYRVLDAQFLGVAQRRRRVFVVGYLGDWRRAAAVLFERHSLSGHPAPRREARKDLAPTISARPTGGGGLGTDFDLDGGCVVDAYRVAGDGAAYTEGDRTAPLTTGTDSSASIVAFSIMPMNSGKDFKGRETDIAQPVMAAGPAGGNQGGDYIVQPVAFALRGREGGAMPEVCEDGSVGTVRAADGGSSRDYVAVTPIDMRQASRGATMTNNRAEGSSGGAPGIGIGEEGDPSPTISTSHPPAIAGSAVRRLTPRECERLQGFPDDYTAVPHRGKPAADGPRYKALGNSMAVPVMGWIGQRIQAVEDMTATDAPPPYEG